MSWFVAVRKSFATASVSFARQRPLRDSFPTKNSVTEAIHVCSLASASTALSIGTLFETGSKPRKFWYTEGSAL